MDFVLETTFPLPFSLVGPSDGLHATGPDALPTLQIYEDGALTAMTYTGTVAAKSDLSGAYTATIAGTAVNGFNADSQYEVFAMAEYDTVEYHTPIGVLRCLISNPATLADIVGQVPSAITYVSGGAADGKYDVMTFPDGSTWTHNYDGSGNLTSITPA